MSLDKELEFNLLTKISYLYNTKSDGAELLNLKDRFDMVDPSNQKELCRAYCYNYPDYTFCLFCPDSTKNTKTKDELQGKQPLYTSQYESILGTDPFKPTDTLINNNINTKNMALYDNTNPQEYREIIINGVKYNIYSPYIVAKK